MAAVVATGRSAARSARSGHPPRSTCATQAREAQPNRCRLRPACKLRDENQIATHDTTVTPDAQCLPNGMQTNPEATSGSSKTTITLKHRLVLPAVTVRFLQAGQFANSRGADVLLNGANQYAPDKHDDQAVRGNGEFDQQRRSRAMEMPARNAPFSMTSRPMSSDNASRRTVRVNAPNKSSNADRHIGTAKFRRNGVQGMPKKKAPIASPSAMSSAVGMFSTWSISRRV